MLVNKPAPQTPMSPLDALARGFARADLAAGHVTVVNFFASWCIPCHAEAPNLPLIAAMKGVKLYGVAYKDLPGDARKFLNEVGNPYDRIDLDEAGGAGIEWGVTGVPETFVIDGTGTVLLRHAGPLTKGVIEDQIVPAIAKARRAS
jgi:cytochrome c biogenesis protein CcmG/thiol:disulfide interchange protein DsbE